MQKNFSFSGEEQGGRLCMSVVKKDLLQDLEDLLRFQFLVQQEQRWDEYDLLEEKIERLEKEITEPEQPTHSS